MYFLIVTQFLLILLLSPNVSEGKTVYYELDVSYITAAPDGVSRRVLGINGQFPAPTLRAEKGDWLRMKVINHIGPGEITTVHWHGIEQFLTPFHDGPRMITQCDIPFNHSYTYEYQLLQSGTYWYHSHAFGQLTDGMWGVLIVDNVPEVHKYDDELLMVVTNWYHMENDVMTQWYENVTESRGQMPCTDSILINGRGYYPCKYAHLKNVTCDPTLKGAYPMFEVERGKTYRIRAVNPSPVSGNYLSIDGHKLEAIETDGVDTTRVKGVDQSYLFTGVRNSYLMKADGELDQYWIRIGLTDTTLHKWNETWNINPYPEVVLGEGMEVYAVLKYKDSPIISASIDDGRVRPEATQGRPEFHDLASMSLRTAKPHDEVVIFDYNPIKDPMNVGTARPPYPNTSMVEDPVRLNFQDCIPFGTDRAPDYVNQTVFLRIPFFDKPDETKEKPPMNATFHHFNTSSLDKPAMIKILLGEDLPAELNAIVINGFGHDYVVEVILEDEGDTGHPFHLHGHTFWSMGYGLPGAGPFSETIHRPLLKSFERRETLSVRSNSWTVIRFRADNPGVWLFHCHINFHFEVGMGLVFVEGAEQAREMYKIPNEMKDLCRANGIVIDPQTETPQSTTPQNNGGTVKHAFVSLITMFSMLLVVMNVRNWSL